MKCKTHDAFHPFLKKNIVVIYKFKINFHNNKTHIFYYFVYNLTKVKALQGRGRLTRVKNTINNSKKVGPSWKVTAFASVSATRTCQRVTVSWFQSLRGAKLRVEIGCRRSHHSRLLYPKEADIAQHTISLSLSSLFLSLTVKREKRKNRKTESKQSAERESRETRLLALRV